MQFMCVSMLQYCDKYADFAGSPHVEEWKKELCLAAVMRAQVDLEMYRDSSYEDYGLPHQNSKLAN